MVTKGGVRVSRRRRYAAPLVLAVVFAVFVQMVVVLAGRLPAPPFVAVLTLGALAAALLVTPAPLTRIRSLSRVAAAAASVGGALAVFGAPALVAGLRMSDAPAGSIVVFLLSGGWAAATALGGVALAVRARRAMEASWTVAGALLALAGSAGVVACWERPSSFSPFVRFPVQEAGMLLGGILLICGGLLLVRVARRSDGSAALICATAAAAVLALVWWGATDFASGWVRLAEQPLVVCAAALAWGLVSVNWVEVLRHDGPPVAAACVAVTPLLLSGLSLVERLVGVAGPQPLVVSGVIAGSLVVLAGCAAFLHASHAGAAVGMRWLVLVGDVPLVLAAIALALPAIAVSVVVTVTGGRFTGAWSLTGAESLLGWCAVALTALVLIAARDASPGVPSLAALAALVALPWLADVPTHVWSAALAPEIQQYYGTEYGTITFTALADAPLIAAVVLGAGVLLVIMALRRGPRAGATTNGGS